MITYVNDSLFESPAKVLVNTVNTVGVMGKGIAKSFKQIYPEMFTQYQQLCEKKQLQIGKLWLYKTDHKWILNFPTKIHWRQPSKPEYIEAGLKAFIASYPTQGITSIAFPELGCGNGELDWEKVVQPLMSRYLGNLGIDVFIHLYGQDCTRPEHKDIAAMTAWLRSEPRTLAFSEMWNDLRGIIGSGLALDSWEGTTNFKVFITTRPENGLRIRIGKRNMPEVLAKLLAKVIPARWQPRTIGLADIFVPQEAMLDLWQIIRGYGFCVPRMMPAGLDVLSPYVMALLSHLEYMKPVELSFQSRRTPSDKDSGLRLFALPVAGRDESSEQAYLVSQREYHPETG